MTVQGCHYKDIAVSRYRVWCLEELRRRFSALADEHQAKVKALLPHKQADILWADTLRAESNFNADNHLPFGPAINVFKDGLP